MVEIKMRNIFFTIFIMSSVSFSFAADGLQGKSLVKDQPILQILQASQVFPLNSSRKNIGESIFQSPEDHAIFFFASWCSVCREEISRYLQKVKSGTCSRISFVSVDTAKSQLDKYLPKIPQIKTNIYWDQKLILSEKLQIKSLPTALYVDRKKKAQKLYVGGEKSWELLKIMIADAEGRHGQCE